MPPCAVPQALHYLGSWVLRNAYIEAGIAHEDGTAGVVFCRWTATSHNYADDQPWDQPSSGNRVTLDSGSSGDWLVRRAVEAKVCVVSSRLTRSRAAGVIFTRQCRHVSCGMGDLRAMRCDSLPPPATPIACRITTVRPLCLGSFPVPELSPWVACREPHSLLTITTWLKHRIPLAICLRSCRKAIPRDFGSKVRLWLVRGFWPRAEMGNEESKNPISP